MRIDPVLPENKTDAPALIVIDNPQTIRDDYRDYLSDESRCEASGIDQLVFAHSEEQVVHTLKDARQRNIPVTVSSGRTGITGGAVPQGGIILSMERMNRILDAGYDSDSDQWILSCEPGITLETIQEILASPDPHHPQVTEGVELPGELAHWFYPPDPTETTAHLGGTVATNASGARSYFYGSTRNFICRLRVVLADGTVFDIPRGKYFLDRERVEFETESGLIILDPPQSKTNQNKSVAGYFLNCPMDLIDLFIGSEGTLGVITRIDITLLRKPDFTFAGVAYFPSEDKAVKFVCLTKSSELQPVALEFFDSRALDLIRHQKQEEGTQSALPQINEDMQAAVYFEQSCAEEDFEQIYEAWDALLTECGTRMEDTWGAMDESAMALMKHFRHAVPEMINGIIGQRKTNFPNLHKVGTDLAVPDGKLEAMLHFYHDKLNDSTLEYAIFGHIGDNHLHVNMIPQNETELEQAKQLYREFAEKAVALGGTLSAEHGIGKLKRSLLPLMYSEPIIREMRKIKEIFDSRNLLGRGNIFNP